MLVITPRSLRLLQQLRKTVGAQTDDAVRLMAGAWSQSWSTLSGRWDEALDETLDAMAALNRWPTPNELNRLRRLANATRQTHAALSALAVQAGKVAGDGAAQIVAFTAAAEPAMMAAQLPAAMSADGLRGYVRKIAPSSLEQITVRVRQQIHQQLWPLSTDAVGAMRRRLVTGIAEGSNPRQAAREIVRDVEGAFNGGLARAMNISRTEMLDAYRDTSSYVHQRNADVLESWIWLADLGPRCCPGCWAMHGTEWGTEVAGPWDHQSGRCARMPKVKSWADLGIDIPEPDDDFVPKSKERFAALTRDQQLSIMGPRRLKLLDAGDVTLSDLAALRTPAGWRPSYAPMAVRDLEALAQRRRRRPT